MSELIPIYNPADSIADVVFVHGLGGDSRGTWSLNDGECFWPEWIGRDIDYLSVWAVNYDAKVIFKSMPIVDRAKNLSHLLKARNLGEKPIIFITHSLGGLLTKQILRKSQETSRDENGMCPLFDSTVGVVFFATPHSGSGLANTIGMCCNSLVRYLKKHDDYIRDLGDWYRRSSVQKNIKTLSFHENKNIRLKLPFLTSIPTPIMVVNPTSANPATSDDESTPLDEDHFSICKIASVTSTLYCSILAFLYESLGIPKNSSSENPVKLINDIRISISNSLLCNQYRDAWQNLEMLCEKLELFEAFFEMAKLIELYEFIAETEMKRNDKRKKEGIPSDTSKILLYMDKIKNVQEKK